MPKDFKLDRKILSSYYISVIFAYFIFLTLGDNITLLANNVSAFLFENFKWDFVSNGRFWYFFVFLCLILVFVLRKFIVEPLGFFVDTDTEPWWETAVFGFLVFGLFLYLFNQAFGFAMPNNFPIWIIKLFGGYKNTYQPSSSLSEVELSWSFLPYLWYIFPIVFMYWRRKIQIKE